MRAQQVRRSEALAFGRFNDSGGGHVLWQMPNAARTNDIGFHGCWIAGIDD
jgi:hypothetical protein